jgi:hypothetical protein
MGRIPQGFHSSFFLKLDRQFASFFRSINGGHRRYFLYVIEIELLTL